MRKKKESGGKININKNLYKYGIETYTYDNRDRLV